MLTAALALALGLSSVAGATTYTVNTLQDSSAVANTCSLRDAINAANGTPKPGSTCKTTGNGHDAINFSVTGTITLASTLPEVTDSQLMINGPAAPRITIDGNHRGQVMQVASGATLNLNNLTIANGESRSGGISNEGTLTVINSFFSGNDAIDFGGAIDNSGTLTVANSVFFGNGSSGIANEKTGTSTVTNSTFSSNRGTGSGFGDGGGILNLGTLTVTNSTFSGNGGGEFTPLDEGGAIFNFGTLTITNSTFSHNSARFGGAIGNEGTLFVTNSTFAGNAISGAEPGGGASIANDGKAAVKSTILATNGRGGNCLQFEPIIDAGYNISDDASCGFAKTGSAHNGDGVDPLLSPAGLADNGGPTQTIALQEGSPAIDAIPLADCTDQAAPPQRITNDQRGFLRPDDREGFCDIGAYESNALPVENLDKFVTFCQFASCGSGAGPFAADAAGCPAGQAAYSFNAVLTDGIAQMLTSLQINVDILTNGNQWKLPKGQLLAAGGAVPLSATGAHDSHTGGANTGTLKPGQSATVPFTICLANRNRFQFFVDVYGNTVSAP